MSELNRGGDLQVDDVRWKLLHKLSGWAALIAALLFRRNLAEEFLLLRLSGIIHSGPQAFPTNAADWFTLLRTHPLIGLTFLNLFDVVNYALVGLIFLGLCPALLGRRVLETHTDKQRAEWASIFTHYAMMIALGVAIFPAIRLVQQRPGKLPIPQQFGQALVWLTGLATLLTVLNLAIRGLGAPFAAKLSSRLATDWMYAGTRNPMLLCTLALLVSVGLRYRSIWFVVWVIVIVSPGWIFFVRIYEELELEIRFGDSYLEYKARTPFLLPGRPRHTARGARA